MRTYLLKRLLLIPLTLLGISFVSFGLIRLSGDPAVLMIGSAATGNVRQSEMSRKAFEDWRRQRGLHLPWPRHYIVWLGQLVRLDFGNSWDQPSKSVLGLVAEKLPATLLLNSLAFVLFYVLAIPLGVYSAVRAGTLTDRILTFLLFLLYSLPTFWVALLLIYGFGDVIPFIGLSSLDADRLGFFDRLRDRVLHLILPVFCLTYVELAALSRYLRSGMMEVLRQDYIRTARAKGLPEGRVVFRHALRNAMIPLVTLAATILPAMIGGSFIIEVIFSIDGMGRLTFWSITQRDLPVVMGTVTISALLTLAGLLLADILYVVVNPTISFDKPEAA